MVKRILKIVVLLAAVCSAPCGGLLNGSLAQAAAVSEGFESGNFSILPWTTGGTANWSIATDFRHSGTYSAKAPVSSVNPDIFNPAELSYLETTLNLLATQSVTFWYKVSSEDGFDFLKFYIDGNEINSWTGEIGWTQATYSVPAGNHTFRWEYTKDNTGRSGSDTAWIDDINFPNATTALSYTINSPGTISNGSISCASPVVRGSNSLCTIAPTAGYHLDPSSFTDNGVITPVTNNSYTITNVQGDHTITGKFVLDAPNYLETFESIDFSKFPWVFGGTLGAANWSVTPSGYSGIYGGTYAAEAPETLNDSETSYLETMLNIPAIGVVSFWYKVSSEEDLGNGGDYLRFYIDGIEQSHVDPVSTLSVKGWSGEIDWNLAQYPIDAGTHTFRWEYVKDGVGSSGFDKAWIDDIVFPGAVYKPTYTITVPAASSKGSISCVPATVAHGLSSVCTISPASGYHLATFTDDAVDKLSAVADNKYTISNIAKDHAIAGTFVVNSYIEDFETGNFLKFPWLLGATGGGAGWIVTASGHQGSYAGIYAAQSPMLGHNQSSYIETTQSVPPSGGTISFWYRVSSEVQSDYLKFYIDDFTAEVGSWSGEHGWTYASFLVPEGSHTFRWEYSKDGSDALVSISDKAWVDDIVISGSIPVKLKSGTTLIDKPTLQEAYNTAAIRDDVIMLRAGTPVGGLTADRNISVTISGGYADDFTSKNSMTSVGAITLRAGTVQFDNIIIAQ